jgi:hypothetical protein
MLTTASKKPAAKGSDRGVGVNREHAVGDACVADAGQPLVGAEPQVRGPHLHAELAVQEDRRRAAAAAQVDPHAGPQLHRLDQPLGEPQ